ncbi:MFS general substrate transporter [Aaosphaeria arxii CBS 175.79]|uniref:MFS general substrate transporter n=1 Tax=Aaosphaeria arxii CBS 175.79 TaxID=1450172 RepID=A0A6A5XCK0_9PLEO|nr:MFS general substrate transporter [Aaosphaeria arxii CBS 175.79]KAF2010621.1 MFS general substrate transporter [Aaosphaeria arxii CBS 175.79]
MTERRLPVKQLVILSICRFAEPIALTSVFPYLPEMIESFGVPKNDIARWAGLTSATFSICQACTGIIWGAISDRIGRKPTILIGLTNTMITMLLWGFSTTLPMAMVARGLQGFGSGNVGILRTTVAELCPWKELQPRAFSIMPLVFTVGSIIGPSLGGGLSNPMGVDPNGPRGTSLLERYPYCLPNIVAACFFITGIITGWLFLKETLESKKNAPDYGRMVGDKLTAWFRKTFRISKREKKIHHHHHEREPLLGSKDVDDEETGAPDAAAIKPTRSLSALEILTPQTQLNLIVYTLLAFFSLSYDQLLPVFMHHPPQSIDDPAVKLPLKFSGGFGIDSRRIGAIFTVFSIACTLFQFLAFPAITRHFGVLPCLRMSLCIYPFVFFITPFVSLLPTQSTKELGICALMIVRGFAGTFAFPCSTIMITNSAPSLRVLGVLNGLATSVSAVGRAAGPATGGNLFTLGAKIGYVIIPFWALSVIAAAAFVPTFWLVEGKGFGDDPDEADGEGSVLSASASSGSSIIVSGEEDDEDEGDIIDDNGRRKHVDAKAKRNGTAAEDEEGQSESEYGEPTNLLSHTLSYGSSVAYHSSSEDEDNRYPGAGVATRYKKRRASSSSHTNVGGERSRSRRRSTAVRRRSSVPVGMGIGFRRLSSNLGSTGFGPGGSAAET